MIWQDVPCLFCGQPEMVDIFEIWDAERSFMIETCCEGLHDAIIEEMSADPAYGRELLRLLDVEAIMGRELRRVVDDGSAHLVLDWNLEVRPIKQRAAKDFVRAHHEHCPPPAGDRFRAGIWNGRDLIGVAIVGRPVARRLDHTRIVEVNRLCVRRCGVPRPIVWNACSQLYGWAANEAKRRGFEKIITYTLASEAGTALKAAGWQREATTSGGTWHRARRPRTDRSPIVPKVRWARQLAGSI